MTARELGMQRVLSRFAAYTLDVDKSDPPQSEKVRKTALMVKYPG